MTLLGSLLSADFIGGEFNLGYYAHSPSGTISYKGDVLDLNDDLKLDTQSNIFLKAYIEHPLPFIPNIKLGYTDFTHKGDGKIAHDFKFAYFTFRNNQDLESHLNLKMYDMALYYEILDNWVSVDVGLNIKYIDGYMSAQTLLSGKKSATINLPVPMLYGKARFDVPTTDLSFQLEGNYIHYQKNEIIDVEIGARYTFIAGLGVEVGYKTFQLMLDKDDTLMDADFSGMYGKLVWDF